jgi:hypothetical protein
MVQLLPLRSLRLVDHEHPGRTPKTDLHQHDPPLQICMYGQQTTNTGLRAVPCCNQSNVI